MKTKEETIAILEQYAPENPSKWREEAEFRRANRAWLRHSQRIAVMMLGAMESKHMTQQQLADTMGCSQQYVSRVLKGRENLSLETISKIENALELNVMA